MPIVHHVQHNKPVLRCLNHIHGTAAIITAHVARAGVGAGATTMVVQPLWVGLTHFYAPGEGSQHAPGDPFAPYFHPPDQAFPANTLTPVRCYVCSVCGYVELYSGLVTDPDVWPSPLHGGQ